MSNILVFLYFLEFRIFYVKNAKYQAIIGMKNNRIPTPLNLSNEASGILNFAV